MFEFFKEFFTSKDAFARAMRATAIAITAASASPQGQSALAGLLGEYAILVPIIAGLFGGAIAVGEKNQ